MLKFFKIIFLSKIFLVLGSCSVEELKTKEQVSEVNKTQELIPSGEVSFNVTEGSRNFTQGINLENLVERKFKEIVPLIEKSFPKPSNVDYDKIENSFYKILLDQNNEGRKKYQFICDENERWIYRCNMETGEIECFSMSSNKLRLLSSTK